MAGPSLPSLYIPHGGGPCFFIRPEDMPPGMPRDMWDPMAEYLRGVDAAIGRRPRAVIVVSAHWLTPKPMFGNAAAHPLLYDYYNFPDYTYRLHYPVKGDPALATRAVELLAAAGIDAGTDDRRGIDHGVFVPFKLIYPQADVPIVPMSLQQNLRADQHQAIGAALAPLRDEDVLIVGSGMSFHNMQMMMGGARIGSEPAQFDHWLADTATAAAPARRAGLDRWTLAPGARASHPPRGEEHLLPLMVAAGAAGEDRGRKTFGGSLNGTPVAGFTFG